MSTDESSEGAPPIFHEVSSILAGLGFEQRKETEPTSRLVELDVWGEATRLPHLTARLRQVGLSPFRPVRDTGHRFYLSFAEGRWIKVDVKLRDHAGSLPTDVLRLLTRQRGLVVALLGADGAGKSTAAECLHAALPFDVSIRYLGTKRRVRSADGVGSARPSRSRIRKLAGLARWIVTTVSELWRIELAARRGTIVVCDRHPLESGLLGDEMPLVRRMKRLVVRTVLPRPDVIVLLSASGELLHRRKGEHSPEYLDHMTAVWRDVVTEAGGVTVAADRSPAAVCDELQELIWGRLADRNAF